MYFMKNNIWSLAGQCNTFNTYLLGARETVCFVIPKATFSFIGTKVTFLCHTCLTSGFIVASINMRALILLMPSQTSCGQQLNFVTFT